MKNELTLSSKGIEIPEISTCASLEFWAGGKYMYMTFSDIKRLNKARKGCNKDGLSVTLDDFFEDDDITDASASALTDTITFSAGGYTHYLTFEEIKKIRKLTKKVRKNGSI